MGRVGTYFRMGVHPWLVIMVAVGENYDSTSMYLQQ